MACVGAETCCGLDELPGFENVEGGGCVFGHSLDVVADAVLHERDFEHVVMEDVDDAEGVSLVGVAARSSFFAEG
jgi:hypothetical protein